MPRLWFRRAAALVVGVVGVVVGAGCSSGGEPLAGTSTATVVVTSADGTTCELCMWLADESSERQQGLAGVTDLGDPVGMAFVWDEPVDSNFVMIDTPLPLSIAWFDESGRFLGDADMEPCLGGRAADCERYSAPGSYTVAIEMVRSDFDAVGIAPGSTIEVLPGSESDTCSVSVVTSRP